MALQPPVPADQGIELESVLPWVGGDQLELVARHPAGNPHGRGPHRHFAFELQELSVERIPFAAVHGFFRSLPVAHHHHVGIVLDAQQRAAVVGLAIDDGVAVADPGAPDEDHFPGFAGALREGREQPPTASSASKTRALGNR